MPDDPLTTPGVEPAPAATEEPAPSTTPTGEVAPAQPEGAGSAPAVAPETPVPGSEPQDEPPHVKEIKALRKRAQEAERQAEYHRGLAEGRQPSPAAGPQAPAELKKPNINDFETEGAYQAAVTDYLEKRQEQLVEQRVAVVRQKQEHETRAQSWRERVAKEAETDPDLPALVADPRSVPCNGPMVEAILESDVGPKVFRYLYNNQNEARRLCGLSAVAVGREIAKIEAKLSAAPATALNKIPSAPPPITPIQGTGNSTRDFFDPNLSTEERIALSRSQGG